MTPTDVAPLGAAGPAFGRRERDFLLLNIFVLLQHGYVEKASILAEALHRAGDDTAEVHLARAVLRFTAGRFAETIASLDDLDRVDPMERFGAYRLTERQRMRRYLKTRSLFELGDKQRVRDSLDSYLRHGDSGAQEAE